MSMKNKRKKQANDAIAKTDWFCFMSPQISLNIKRSLLGVMAKAAGVSELDAAGGIAHLCKPHGWRLSTLEVGQSEAIITTPFKATWFVLIFDDALYVSDEMFFPFE